MAQTMKVPSKTTIAASVQAALPNIPPAPEPQAPDQPQERLAPTPELNPRNQILKEIAARSNADANAAAAETLPVTDDDGEPVAPAPAAPEEPEAPAPEQPTDAPPAAPVEAPAAPVAPVEAFDPNAEFSVIVEGRPMKVKGSQIIERGKMAIQKETAADYKLELASRLLAEAQAQRKAPQAAPVPAQEAISDAQLAQAIQFGTTDQATAAIAELKKRSGGELTQDSVKQMMAQTMPEVVRDQLNFQEGVNFVKTEYADLLADPYLQPLFVMKEQQLRQAGDKRPHKDIYKVIGEDIRTHFNRPKTTSAAPAAAPATTREQKVAAKAAAPAAPKLASARMEAAGEPKPPTREEIFEKMRRSRGQGQQPRTIN